MKYLKKHVDISNPHSTISRVRKKRCKLLLDLIHTIDNNDSIRILDVGGTLTFWETCGFVGAQNCEITLLNLNKFEIPHKYKYIKSIQGNGTDMRDYKDKEFDLVVSDSVIKHVGDYENQKKMAKEIQRVGKRYFVQTPNFFFPIEPHFLFPFFQFLPLSVKTLLLTHFSLGGRQPTKDPEKSEVSAKYTRMLKKREVKQLFPEGVILKEKLYGMTNSFIVVGGWDFNLLKSTKVDTKVLKVILKF